MAQRHRQPEEYELLARNSSEYSDIVEADLQYPLSSSKWSVPSQYPLWPWIQLRFAPLRTALYHRLFRSSRGRRQPLRIVCWTIAVLACGLLGSIILTIIFWPSYTHLPEHYLKLQKASLESTKPGRGNVNHEKIFIATALYDPGGQLVRGEWGKAVLSLVDLLGPENVYLSIYENDVDDSAKAALDEFKRKINCDHTVLSEHLPLEEIPRVTVPSGEERIKRIAFLADVRNRALRPLEANSSSVQYDKLLYINDVVFKPIDAVQLLFSTNVDASGRTQYGAACAVDFINAFKFYDRFATRDLEGYEMGIPFYPWFTNAGAGFSRQDVLDQKDAVRVRACWGGMTAFEAKWFLQTSSVGDKESSQASPDPLADVGLSPLRFRYEEDPFWDASECCLIHADLTYLRQGQETTTESGIVTNPYIRVAYDSRTLGWLPFTRRAERLYPLVHNILNHVVGLPHNNRRRLEQPGEEVTEKVWHWDESGEEDSNGQGEGRKGSYHDVKRVALPGRFCGSRTLLVLNDDPKPGEKKWMKVRIPVVPD